MMKLAIAALAAVTLSVSGAQPKTTSIHFDGFCNGLDITPSANHLVRTVENGCAKGLGGGVGALGTIFGFPNGKRWLIGENYDDGAGEYVGEEFWIISAPLVTGGTYEGWKHKSCCALTKFASGTYSVTGAAEKHGGKRLMAR